jgi:hypothetical protein
MIIEMLCVLLAVLAYYAYTRWIPLYYARRDIAVPEPTLKRPGILFGYYGAFGEQVAETRGHVNLLWSIQFEGLDKLIQNIRDAAMPTIIDVAYQLTERNRNGLSVLRADGEGRLREFLTRLELEGVLHHVVGLTPGDEPNSQFESLLEWTRACDIMRMVAAEFQDLADVKTVMLLNGAAPMEMWVPHADIVGFNCYNRRSSIFRKSSKWPPKWDGEYTKLRKWLRPDQRTFLVPGGAKGANEFEQDPTPFINAAHTYQEVMAVVPFLWGSAVDKGNQITGIRDNAMRDAYVSAGRGLIGGVQ